MVESLYRILQQIVRTYDHFLRWIQSIANFILRELARYARSIGRFFRRMISTTAQILWTAFLILVYLAAPALFGSLGHELTVQHWGRAVTIFGWCIAVIGVVGTAVGLLGLVLAILSMTMKLSRFLSIEQGQVVPRRLRRSQFVFLGFDAGVCVCVWVMTYATRTPYRFNSPMLFAIQQLCIALNIVLLPLKARLLAHSS
jgi:hypothetical protein